jgi:hypothetical protein
MDVSSKYGSIRQTREARMDQILMITSPDTSRRGEMSSWWRDILQRRYGVVQTMDMTRGIYWQDFCHFGYLTASTLLCLH